MGFLEELKRRKQPIIIDLPVVLEDGKPAQIKCRPVVPGELMNRLDGVGGIPIAQPGLERDVPKDEALKLYRWACSVLIRSIFAIRTIEDGEEVWIDIELTDDEDADTPQDLPADGKKPERTLLRLIDFDYFDSDFVNRVANEVLITNTNFGGDIDDLGRPRFREGRLSDVPPAGQ